MVVPAPFPRFDAGGWRGSSPHEHHDTNDDGWDEPDEDEVTDPDELAEADPDMEQSPLRVEEQPDDA